MSKNKSTTSYNKIPSRAHNLKMYYYVLLFFLFVTNAWPFLIAAIFARSHVFKLMEKFLGQANTENINTNRTNRVKVNTIFDFIESAIGKAGNTNTSSEKIKISSKTVYNKPSEHQDYKYVSNNSKHINTTVKTDTGRSFLAIAAFIILILASIIYFIFVK